jgi:predicted secreted Zn-dependent protease
MVPRRRFLLVLFASALAVANPGYAASVAKTYSYYTIGGETLDELEEQLLTQGPQVSATGRKHPGATQMEFTTRLGYAETERDCKIVKAEVELSARIILPRWRRPAAADQDVRMVWETLSADISRHEESHVVIAKNHARELEQALLAIRPRETCALVAAEVQETTARILKKHDEAQMRFDRIELIGFERRFLRLMENRMQWMETDAPPR